jgi:LmbE family N-acetylglucosaminyl deacetylase
VELGTVLSVWAHPDDEAYLASGLMAQAVRDGGRVVCVTATRGEGGSLDEQRWPPETMGEVREGELLACLARLGVTEHEFLGLPDIDMATPLPETHGPGRIAELMDEVQPDTVLTFGPDGMTGHEAHKSVSRWTTDAFHAAAKPGARLFHATASDVWAKDFLPRMLELGVFLPGTPEVVPVTELDLVFELSDELLDLKMAALDEHTSQLVGIYSVYTPEELRTEQRLETYRLAGVKH